MSRKSLKGKPRNVPDKLPPEIIAQIFREDCGIIYRKVRPSWHFVNKASESAWNKVKANKRAGNIYKQRYGTDYEQVKFSHKCVKYRLQSHVIVWILNTGSYPNFTIDHIDRNGLNNKFVNLRDVTQAENNRNKWVCD